MNIIREFGTSEFLFLLVAARWTILLTLASLAIGSVIGLLIAVMRIVPLRPINWLALAYINLLQGTPVLGQLFLFFFGFSIIGIEVGAWAACVAAFSLYTGAFLGEIWRGSLQSVPRTQWEASAAMALNYGQRLRYVIIPQAVRLSVAPTIGFIVQLLKNTSLASIVGFVELMRAAQLMNGATFSPIPIYLTVAAIYFIICFSLSQVSQHYERTLHVPR